MKRALAWIGYIAGSIMLMLSIMLATESIYNYFEFGFKNYFFAVGLLYIFTFPLNYYLAVTRGKNPFLMMLISIPLSWLVTLTLSVQEKKQVAFNTHGFAVWLASIIFAISTITVVVLHMVRRHEWKLFTENNHCKVVHNYNADAKLSPWSIGTDSDGKVALRDVEGVTIEVRKGYYGWMCDDGKFHMGELVK